MCNMLTSSGDILDTVPLKTKFINNTVALIILELNQHFSHPQIFACASHLAVITLTVCQ